MVVPVAVPVQKKSLLAVLACAHCSLTLVAGLAAAGAAALPTVFGVNLGKLFVPLLLTGAVAGFLLLAIREQRRAAACEVEPADD